MFDDAPSGRKHVEIGSAPPLISVGCVVASAERNTDIAPHLPRTIVVKMPALKFVRSVSFTSTNCFKIDTV
jgi:hypothetical protein